MADDVFNVSDNDEYDRLRDVQRLKAAVHYTVGQITEEIGEEENVTFNKQFIAVLAEATFKYATTMATDLEMFARHAKRSTINGDDVKLLVRKSKPLLDHITSLSEKYASDAQEKRAKKPSRSKKKSAASKNPVVDSD